MADRPRRMLLAATIGLATTSLVGCPQSMTSGNLVPPPPPVDAGEDDAGPDDAASDDASAAETSEPG